jgi:putative hydroxymethylpyrimidine transport system substrate-binding protein
MMLVILVVCGPGAVRALQPITLMLDWFPNIDHLPIYVAREKGFFASEGVYVKVVSPSETSDALKLAAADQIQMAVSYAPQTIIAAATEVRVTAVGRLIEHPLTTLLFLQDAGIQRPQDLNGKRIGYTVPGLMDVLLQAFAKINGIEQYTPINVGFAIAQSLTAGKVDAVMGPFKTYETVQMGRRGYATRYFELEQWGIPDYDELVFVCGPKFMQQHPRTVAVFVQAIQKGIRFVRAHPDEALAIYFNAVPEAERAMETDAFRLTEPYYATTQELSVKRWQQFADFALRHGLINQAVDVRRILWNPAE